MKTQMKTKMKKQRGYILLEAAIAGSITALGLSFALERVAEDRVRISNAANEASAVALADAKLNEILDTLEVDPWAALTIEGELA